MENNKLINFQYLSPLIPYIKEVNYRYGYSIWLNIDIPDNLILDLDLIIGIFNPDATINFTIGIGRSLTGTINNPELSLLIFNEYKSYSGQGQVEI